MRWGDLFCSSQIISSGIINDNYVLIIINNVNIHTLKQVVSPAKIMKVWAVSHTFLGQYTSIISHYNIINVWSYWNIGCLNVASLLGNDWSVWFDLINSLPDAELIRHVSCLIHKNKILFNISIFTMCVFGQIQCKGV